MRENYVTVTDSAQGYLKELLEKQDNPGIGVRIFVEKPGTPYAECCMAYCPEGESEEGDERIDLDGFAAFLDQESIPYLEDAVIDFSKDRMGGQLTFRAPKSKVPQIAENSTVEEQINYVLYSEINPQLAAHGGHIQLVELLEDDTLAILKFGGGCQGCGMVDMTLKEGVEKTLLEKVPQLKRVADVTDHSEKEHAYFK